MKKLYYVVKKELQDIDGFEETTGHKTVSTYSAVIKDGAPEIEHQFDVELSNEDNSIEGISDYLIDNGMGDEKFEFIELLNKDVYYQPDFDIDETLITPNGVELWSYYVYTNFDNARKDFPDKQIIAYKGDDIENPYFIDGDGNY